MPQYKKDCWCRNSLGGCNTHEGHRHRTQDFKGLSYDGSVSVEITVWISKKNSHQICEIQRYCFKAIGNPKAVSDI